MARSFDSDPMFTHQFAMLEVPVNGAATGIPGISEVFSTKRLQSTISGGKGFVGFKTLALPQVTHELKEIKEGNQPYKHHVASGIVASGEVTMSFAVFPSNADFYVWFHNGVWGKGVPRRDFLVLHMDRDRLTPRRVYRLEGCVPTGWKPTSDFDADSGEIAMEEMTMAVHQIIIPSLIPSVTGTAARLVS